MNTVPYEVIAAAPIALYTAAADTAKPALDIDPPIAWTKLGLSGDLNYDDGSGVEVSNPQNLSPWRALGDAGSRKVFRQDEDCKIKVKVVDLTLETMSQAINGNSVTTVAPGVGTVGYKWIGLSRGLSVNTLALLIRLLISPYGADWIGQYYFPRCAQSGSPTQLYKKTEPVGLELEFMALVKPDAATPAEYFGRLEFGNADATT